MQGDRLGYRIIEEIERPSEEIIEELRKLDITLLADGSNSRVAMDYRIKPIKDGHKIVGPAITVKLTLGDSLLVSKAVDLARPGDVVVIDGAGTNKNALWGDMRSLSAKHKGLEGTVIDGAIRDIVGCRELDYPLFCKYVVCGSSTKSSPGEINVPINCGEIVVNPGDVIVGDENGVIVLAKDRLEEIIHNAKEKEKKMESVRKAILEGKYIPEDFMQNLKKLGF